MATWPSFLARSIIRANPALLNGVPRTVTPRRPPNRDLRTREHLTEAEVERLIKATGDNVTATGTRP
jgi:hypothetical protein